MKRVLLLVTTLLGSTGTGGCSSDPTGVVLPSDVKIRLHLTGGITGLDYAILVDGASGIALGESCVSQCPFAAGDTLLALVDAQLESWSRRLREAGILDLDGTDYGSQCCDFFDVELSYSDGLEEASIRGTTDRMPASIQAVVNDLAALSHGLLSVVVDPAVRLGTVPTDPVGLRGISLSGSTLLMDLEYTGGCKVHAFALVWDGAWRESFPVQTGLVLAHDDQDDTCEALIRVTREFRLQPLEAAYAAVYPAEPPGERRLVLDVVLPGDQETRLIHTF